MADLYEWADDGPWPDDVVEDADGNRLRVGARLVTDGERYAMLVDVDFDDVALFPLDVVRSIYRRVVKSQLGGCVP